jgi:2,4-dienoyl-CoA reductase-like NADH-dependent reductase (Old Yellow Enzyme family)
MNQLFEKTAIGGMELRNRFVRSATFENMTEGTKVTDALVDTYRKLAEGGVALITTGITSISEKGQAQPNMPAMDGRADVAGLTKLSGIAHEGGAKIMAQLVHAGSNRTYDPGFPPEGPSVVQNRQSQATPVEMTQRDIADAVSDFAAAAARAVEYGYDAVQIHAAHEYLLSQFLSPYTNQRSDQYGGSIENRARPLFEVYQAVRTAVGNDFPVTVKIDAKQYYDDGLTWEDSSWVCRELSALGVDAIELSAIGGQDFFGIFMDIPDSSKEAYLADFAKDLKSQIDTPVMLVGGLRSMDTIERLYEEKATDFFSLSRPLISEPDLVSKFQSGVSRKARCTSCTKCLFGVLQGTDVARCHQFGNGE